MTEAVVKELILTLVLQLPPHVPGTYTSPSTLVAKKTSLAQEVAFNIIQKHQGSSKSNLKILPSTTSRCLKVTEKVSFNSASETSFVYILSEQKFIKMRKKNSNETI